jgi:hypothetical protein
MAAIFSDVSAGRPLPPARTLLRFSVRRWVNPMVKLLRQIKNPLASSGIERAAFRFEAQFPNQLQYYNTFVTVTILTT